MLIASNSSTINVTSLIDFRSVSEEGVGPERYAFGQPIRILSAQTLSEVMPLLNAVHRLSVEGLWCVGYVRYEAAPAFDAAMTTYPPTGPLAWFAVYDEALPWPQSEDKGAEIQPHLTWESSVTRRQFDEAITQVHRAIESGTVYQVNFTAPLHGRVEAAAGGQVEDSIQFFHALRRSQPHAYAAWINTGHEQVISVSPELFFDWQGSRIVTRPMKGTAARGSSKKADAEAAAALRESSKERAENVMIVDLLRNDVSRIALPSTVQVERLFEVTAWPTVWQLTSTISAQTVSGTTLAGVFQALFPCGSVTGAPKLSSMRFIQHLERQPRGVYCGAVGIVRPGGAATFNVPIRTVVMSDKGSVCGIGSGITIDSDFHGEWAEWRNKRAFLQRASAPFQLLETLRLKDGVAHNAIHHLMRMARSATHFGYAFDHELAVTTLTRLAVSRPYGVWRIRLLLDRQGRLQSHADVLPPSPQVLRLKLAPRPFEEAGSEFVRFKTTRREHYDDFAPADPDVFDTILWNERGEITECTRGNLAFKLKGRWVTPAANSGLLSGVERELRIADGSLAEGLITRDDLDRVQEVAFINSLRGWLHARIATAPQGTTVC